MHCLSHTCLQADYPSIGQPVKPTSFLPMKTPMSLEIISNWSLPHVPKHTLTVNELLTSQESLGRRVGMIIDLANHECLYADDIPANLEYAHVQLVAKVLPPQEAIDEVQRTAQGFWKRRPGDYIAIHCAYGFNRTGFVVCAYLCQACGMSVDEALESFAEARPPGVKHGKFVDELYSRYGLKNRGNMSPTEDDSQSQSANGLGCRNTISQNNDLPTPDSQSVQEPFDIALAQCLDGRSLMRRETSLGLAKALHEDFGVHGSTPRESSPLMDRLKEEGERAMASPPTAPTDPQFQQGTGIDNESLSSAFRRNLSFESDNQSLGVSARQVMLQLQGSLKTRSNTVAELSEQDVEDWDKVDTGLASRKDRRGCRPM